MPSPRVPLAYRVPNPPATFLGRREELRTLRAMLRRAPVLVVCGVGGLGKTSLAAAAVQAHLRERLERAVMVGLRASKPFGQVLLELVRALGCLGGAPAIALPGRDDEELAMDAIDLAEAHEAVVLLDDVHHAMTEAERLLVSVARYARRSRWIATSRVVPSAPELAGQVLRLGPLTERQLAALAREVDPELSRARALSVAREAAGSPWMLRRLAGVPVATRDEPFEGVDDLGRRVLEVLWVVERPVLQKVLEESVGEDVRPAIDELERRGLVEAVAGGFCLHEAARPWVEEWIAPSSGHARRRAVSALASSGGEAEATEAVRLALQVGDTESALALCRASFDALLRGGQAPTLWKLLAPVDDPAFRSFKLRAALQLADVKVTTVLEEPPADAVVERLLWARALSVEERLSDSERVADAAYRAAHAAHDAPTAFWAGLLHAMAVHSLERAERGVEVLEQLEPVDDASATVRGALLAFYLAEAGQTERALRTLEQGGGRPKREAPSGLATDVLGGPPEFFARYYRMAAYMECGHLDRAHDELTGGKEELGALDSLRATRIQQNAIANLAVARGRLAEARALLERLLRAKGDTVYHAISHLLEVERRMAAGELEGAHAEIDRLVFETRERNPLVHAWCLDTRERLRCLFAEPAESLDLDRLPLGAGSRSSFALRLALCAARAGRELPAPEPRDVEGTILRAMVDATRTLVSGAPAAALARRAIDVAGTHGWGVHQMEARLTLVEALAVSGDRAAALAEAGDVARRAADLPSPRFAAEARLLACALDEPALDPVALEELAMMDQVAPSAARRARALLGAERPTLDAVDAAVVDAVRAQAAARVVSVRRQGGAWRAGWGVDVRRQSVWLPSGRTVSLVRQKLLLKVLEVLATRGGAAGFEDLARDVWGVRQFHPLNDTNRIRVTLHRLRALVEDDPAHPERVVLREAGYELGPEPFTLLAPAG